MRGAAIGDDGPESGDPEPAVLSYTQFRNYLGLLEWRRRRAELNRRGGAMSAIPVPHQGSAAAQRSAMVRLRVSPSAASGNHRP